MTPDELHAGARRELEELGPEPMDLRERARWAEARRVVVDRVASLADWNPGLCREAALVAAEWEPEVASLLLDAADHGGQGERSADGDLRS